MLHSRVGSWSYPPTIDYGGKTYQGQSLWLILKIRKLRTEKVLYHWDRYKCYKSFTGVIFTVALAIGYIDEYLIECSTLAWRVGLHNALFVHQQCGLT